MNGRGWAFILRMADISRVRPAAAPKNTIYICFTTKTQPKHNPNTTKTMKYKHNQNNGLQIPKPIKYKYKYSRCS